jgi:uncharacterized membrane protein YgcG
MERHINILYIQSNTKKTPYIDEKSTPSWTNGGWRQVRFMFSIVRRFCSVSSQRQSMLWRATARHSTFAAPLYAPRRASRARHFSNRTLSAEDADKATNGQQSDKNVDSRQRDDTHTTASQPPPPPPPKRHDPKQSQRRANDDHDAEHDDSDDKLDLGADFNKLADDLRRELKRLTNNNINNNSSNSKQSKKKKRNDVDNDDDDDDDTFDLSQAWKQASERAAREARRSMGGNESGGGGGGAGGAGGAGGGAAGGGAGGGGMPPWSSWLKAAAVSALLTWVVVDIAGIKLFGSDAPDLDASLTPHTLLTSLVSTGRIKSIVSVAQCNI